MKTPLRRPMIVPQGAPASSSTPISTGLFGDSCRGWSSQSPLELVDGHFTVAQDLSKKAAANVLTAMD
ncbi:MAG: hypothetical protein AB1634_16710, partial [Thermodesulfobacteriota bacterium]